MILLDTDICVELLRGNQRILETRRRTAEAVAISFMTVGELFYGAAKSANSVKNTALVEEFILSVQIIDAGAAVMKKFGLLKADLVKQGIVLSDADIMIAASSLAHCDKLITGNTVHFSRFEELKIENWIR